MGKISKYSNLYDKNGVDFKNRRLKYVSRYI